MRNEIGIFPGSKCLLFCILQVPQAEGRVTRRAQKKLNGSVESLQSERVVSNKRKSATKRKVDDSSSYMISEYLDREVTVTDKEIVKKLRGE